jgi:cytidylate kinase
LSDAAAVAQVAEQAIFDLDGRVVIDGHDVTQMIRTPEMDAAAAVVARHADVRCWCAGSANTDIGGVVMEGRDIGTVVFPHADVKLYLDAAPGERARRRANDPSHAASRQGAGVASVAQALEARDHSDRTRTASPLAMAPDAVYVDTTGVEISQVVANVLAIVEGK